MEVFYSRLNVGIDEALKTDGFYLNFKFDINDRFQHHMGNKTILRNIRPKFCMLHASACRKDDSLSQPQRSENQ